MEAPGSMRGESLACPICGQSQIVKGDNFDLMKPLGNIEPICPYCNKPLAKMPKRRSKCPHCGNYFRVRTRPQDRLQVLVTEDQAEEISRQYCEGYGRDPEIWLKEKRQEWDKEWGELNRRSLEHSKSGEWGLYRCDRYGMAEVLRKESNFILNALDLPKESNHISKALIRKKQAVRMYLEVALFDLNGATNHRKFELCDSTREFFDIAPAVMDWLCELSSELGLRNVDLQELFYEITDNYKGFPFPLTTGKAWHRLDQALHQYQEKVKSKEQEEEDDLKYSTS